MKTPIASSVLRSALALRAEFILRGILHEPQPFRVLLAVSGGADSMALAEVFRSIQTAGILEYAIGHVDHGLRAESANDAEFVKAYAEKTKTPYVISKTQPFDGSENVEAWARHERYRLLKQIQRDQNCHVIATAHHSGDQAETMLFRMLSGRMATSSFGIASYDQEQAHWRPLLGNSKAELSSLLMTNSQDFVVDSTNSDLHRTRNFLRHVLLPQIRENLNPSVERSLNVVAQKLSDDEGFLWEKSRLVSEENASSDISFLKTLPIALRWRVLCYLAEREVGTVAREIGYAHFRQIVGFLELAGDGVREFDLSRGVVCECSPSHGIRFFQRSELASRQELTPNLVLSIPGALQHKFSSGLEIRVAARVLADSESEEVFSRLHALAHGSEVHFKEQNIAYFDAESFPVNSLLVRARQDGDFVDVWKRGRRKVKKLFQERGLRLTLRDRIPIVEYAGSIVWIPGVVRSNIAPVTKNSKRVLELKFAQSLSSV